MTKTLRAYHQKPLVRLFDMTKVKVMSVTPRTHEWYNANDLMSPDHAAYKYYLNAHWFNHLSTTRHVDEPLSDWAPVVDQFFRQGTELADRMFHYLLLICTREARHAHLIDTKKKAMTKKFSMASLDYWGEYAQTSKPQAVATLFDIEKFWPRVDMGTYTDWLVWIFNRGKYGGGFGGKKWAEVAEVLRRVVHGEITYEMMIDQAFNSAHNNGPIFNKGMLFEGYSQHFINILDVQRSGQIPMMFSEHNIYGKQHFGTLPGDMVTESQMFSDLWLPNMETDYVDWYKVEALGAVKSYHPQKKYQLETYGADSEHLQAVSQAHLAAPVMYQVMENVSVPMLVRTPTGKFVPYTLGQKQKDLHPASLAAG
jgi:hypothetical protein